MTGVTLATLNVGAGGYGGYKGVSGRPPRLDAIRAAVAGVGAQAIGLIDTFRWTGLFQTEELCELFGYAQAVSIDIDASCGKVSSGVGITVLADCMLGYEVLWIYNRNCLRIQLDVNGRKVDWYVVYLTSHSGHERRQQVGALLEYIQGRQESPVVLMGDLNTLRPEAIRGPYRLLGAARYLRWLDSRMAEVAELAQTDVVRLVRASGFRDELEHEGGPTFEGRVLGMKFGLALDHCFSLLPSDLVVACCGVRRGREYTAASDHFPVWIELAKPV